MCRSCTGCGFDLKCPQGNFHGSKFHLNSFSSSGVIKYFVQSVGGGGRGVHLPVRSKG